MFGACVCGVAIVGSSYMQVYEGGREETTLKGEAPVVGYPLSELSANWACIYMYVLFCFLFFLSRFLCL